MSKKRYIVIGFDGCNPEMVERFLPHLPNFRRLIAGGSWGPMLPTIPCDTPTNWTALATGATAATSGITGFASYVPGDSLRVERRPSNPREYRELRKAEFIWEAADRQGYRSILINYPFSWHSAALRHAITVGGDSIARGLPTLRADGCICTADRLAVTGEGATVLALRQEGDGHVGKVFWGSEQERVWSAVGEVETGRTIESERERAIYVRTTPGDRPRVSIEDASHSEVVGLELGKWSEYKAVRLGDEVGWVRFLLAHVSQDGSSVQICHSQVSRTDGWTKPAHYAAQLLERCGPFQPGEETGSAVGRGRWAGDHTFEAHSETFTKTGEILVAYAGELVREMPDWDHVYVQLHSNDGLNHWMLGHIDPDFPTATPESTALAEAMYLRNYQDTDHVLGLMANLAKEWDAMLVAVADHSAIPTHTWVDTAKPFMDAGLLTFDGEGKWDPTRSAIRKMINHSIYVNLVGRSPDGIVRPEGYESVRDEVISILMDMRDPRTGACPIAVAARREDLDGVGGNGENFGDVIYLMRPGYTNQPASEGTQLTEETLGRFVPDPAAGLEAGYTFHARIQGNHHDYLPNAEYPGVCANWSILLMHGPGIKQGYRIGNARTIDIAPTLAYYVGMAPPAQVDGHVLVEVFKG